MPSLSSNGACYLGQHRNSIEKLSIIFPLLVSQSPFSWAWFDTRTTTFTFWKCWCASKEREFCNNTLHRIAENGKEGGILIQVTIHIECGEYTLGEEAFPIEHMPKCLYGGKWKRYTFVNMAEKWKWSSGKVTNWSFVVLWKCDNVSLAKLQFLWRAAVSILHCFPLIKFLFSADQRRSVLSAGGDHQSDQSHRHLSRQPVSCLSRGEAQGLPFAKCIAYMFEVHCHWISAKQIENSEIFHTNRKRQVAPPAQHCWGICGTGVPSIKPKLAPLALCARAPC